MLSCWNPSFILIPSFPHFQKKAGQSKKKSLSILVHHNSYGSTHKYEKTNRVFFFPKLYNKIGQWKKTKKMFDTDSKCQQLQLRNVISRGNWHTLGIKFPVHLLRFPNMTSALSEPVTPTSWVARPWEEPVPGPTRIPVCACSTRTYTKWTRARTKQKRHTRHTLPARPPGLDDLLNSSNYQALTDRQIRSEHGCCGLPWQADETARETVEDVSRTWKNKTRSGFFRSRIEGRLGEFLPGYIFSIKGCNWKCFGIMKEMRLTMLSCVKRWYEIVHNFVTWTISKLLSR